MTLRLRIGLIIAVVLGGLVVTLSVLVWRLSLRIAEELEVQEVRSEVGRVLELLNGSLADLGTLAARWQPDAETTTLPPETVPDLVFIFGNRGELRYSGRYTASGVTALSRRERRTLMADGAELRQQLFMQESTPRAGSAPVETGFASLLGSPALIAAALLTDVAADENSLDRNGII